MWRGAILSAMALVSTPEGLPFPTQDSIQKNVTPLDKLQNRWVLTQKILHIRLLLAQCDHKSGDANVPLALCSTSHLSLSFGLSHSGHSLALLSVYLLWLPLSVWVPHLSLFHPCFSSSLPVVHYLSHFLCPALSSQHSPTYAVFFSIFSLNPPSQPCFSHLILYSLSSSHHCRVQHLMLVLIEGDPSNIRLSPVIYPTHSIKQPLLSHCHDN